MKLYAVHDRKAKAFTSFHVGKSDAVVSRDFAQAVLDPRSMMGKYAGDYELVSVGDVIEDYDDALEAYRVVQPHLDKPWHVVLTAQQVLDLQPKSGVSEDPAQLRLHG